MLPSTSTRDALLALLLGICLVSLWSPFFPLHAFPLISFSRSVRLSLTLTLSTLMIWCFGHTALFLFLLAKAVLAYLPTALSVTLRPLFPFQLVQYAQVFPLKSAPFCKLFAGLRSNDKSATSLLLSDSFCPHHPVLSSVFFYLQLWQIWQELSSLSCSIRLQWVPGHLLLPENNAADKLTRRGALPAPTAIHCFRTGGVLSHRNSLTHRIPQFPPRNLCSLVTLTAFSFVCAATNTAF